MMKTKRQMINLVANLDVETKSTQFEVLYSSIGDITVEKSWAPLEFDVTAHHFTLPVYSLQTAGSKFQNGLCGALCGRLCGGRACCQWRG